MVNFYEELGIGRDDTVTQIQETLRNLKFQLASKAARPSSQRESWMRQLELIGAAERVFRDEESRERYDVELDRVAVPEAAEIDWTTRAWNYYFADDNDAALIAARRAKEQSPGEPMSFVVSAWVYLKENEPKQAKRDADEAFVLGELTVDSVDVHEVRGAVYAALRQYDRALASFDRALAKATANEKPELYWRKALVHDTTNQAALVYGSCCAGLSLSADLPGDLRERLERLLTNSIYRMDTVPTDLALSIRRYDERRREIFESQLNDETKSRVLNTLDLNIAHGNIVMEVLGRHSSDRAAVSSAEDALAIATPPGAGDSLPIVTMFVAFIVAVIAMAINFIAGLIVFALAGCAIWQLLSEWSKRQRTRDVLLKELARAKEDHRLAQEGLEATESELRRMPVLPIQSGPPG